MLKLTLKAIAALFLLVVLTLLVIAYLGNQGLIGEHQDAGLIEGTTPRPASQEQERLEAQVTSLSSLNNNQKQASAKRILFGDFHVHTTFSPDAMGLSLPAVDGEGAHPPADACDFARYCSSLDFWSINDHAEGMTPAHWQETKESIRQCNAVSGQSSPDTVAFLGYEWSQMNQFERDKHYGHKNVIYKHIEEENVPKRAIASISPVVETAQKASAGALSQSLLSVGATFLGQDYRNFARYSYELNSVPLCDETTHTLELPENCREGVRTPAELFNKLDEGGYESIVIPHGNTWGLYTPPLASWDKQLIGDMQNEDYQFLVEVFSGHGNSEEYQAWRPFEITDNGEYICPEESPEYLPLCRQAGRIIKRNCLAAGIEEDECLRREKLAQQHTMKGDYLEGSIPGARFEEWLDAGQCRDCWAPSFAYRPMVSTQYALAIGNFDENPEEPRRFRFGMLASSDNHTARPGTGFKEFDRRPNTDTVGQKTDFLERWRYFGSDAPTQTQQLNFDGKTVAPSAFQHAERAASFFMTGGLVAVHAMEKSRDGIWDALQQKEVYGTSGDRILLWFDLINPETDTPQTLPMGSETRMTNNPRFRVKAIGAFKQKPGCPEYSTTALSPERLQRLCRGECFNPSDERKLITRIEVVKIQPQQYKNEPVDALIQNNWLVHQCEPNPDGCIFEFEDPEFAKAQRESVYYVRAIEEASDMINAQHLRTQFDEDGMATSVNPCYGDSFKTDYEDDCLAKAEERAWSSPIFIDYHSD